MTESGSNYVEGFGCHSGGPLDHPPVAEQHRNPVAITRESLKKNSKNLKKEQYNEYLEFGSDC